MRKRLIHSLVKLVLLPFLWVPAAAAQEGNADDGWGAEAVADYAFGQDITLILRADPGVAFERATLFLKASSLNSTFTQDFSPATAPSLAGDRPVEIIYRLDLDFVGIAPFATVTYWWELESSDGARALLPEQSFAYDDDRFTWRRLSTPEVTVHWTEGETRLGQTALEIVGQQLDALREVIPAVPPAPLRVYLYPSAADLRAALRLADRDWVDGHADPALGVILVTAVNPRTAPADLQRSLPHELTHLLLYQLDPAGYQQLPIWLNEGLATVAEADGASSQRLALEEALRADGTIPLTRLCAPALEEGLDPALVYAQSASLVQFVRQRWGEPALLRLLAAQVETGECAAAVETALGIELGELERDWLAATAPGSSLRRLTQRMAIWGLFFLVGFGFILLLGPMPRRRVTDGGD